MNAKIILYHTNTEKLPFSKYFNRYLIAKKPKIAEDKVPKMNSTLYCCICFRLKTKAPSIAGVARRKENRADDLRSRPSARPAVMVMPDLETPGTKAMH